MDKTGLLIILSAVVLLLTSCGSSEKNMAEYVIAENFTIYEATSLPASRIISADAQTETTKIEEKNISYSLNDTSLDFIVDGITVKTIDFTYIPDSEKITVADFNCDGYDDIFIPYENSTVYGEYYCYIPIENSFTKNSELAKIGRRLEISGENTLCEKQYDEYKDIKIEYKWTDGKLKPFRKTELYTSVEDYQQHTNVYSYTENGEEYLESSN